ncbi:MAG: BrnT family toxin [Gemmatimonadales bacterium]|nr:BrnT family toxin [Gemmatimonadales bacterium]
MSTPRITWSAAKARSNRRKHGVSFEEACSAFADDDALVVRDHLHSVGEERFHLLGLSDRLRLLVVVHAVQLDGDLIRLISARPATPSERAHYGASRTP